MELIISDDKTISRVQEEFSKHFPYLKIEFVKRPHTAGEASSLSSLIDHHKTIGQVRTIHNTGSVLVTGHTKVAALEKRLQEDFGLAVQVFRRAGKNWLQTTVTDHWTLAEQNHEGMEASAEK